MAPSEPGANGCPGTQQQAEPIPAQKGDPRAAGDAAPSCQVAPAEALDRKIGLFRKDLFEVLTSYDEFKPKFEDFDLVPALQARLSALVDSVAPEVMSQDAKKACHYMQWRLDTLHSVRADCARAAVGGEAAGEGLHFAEELGRPPLQRVMLMRVARNAHLALSAAREDEVEIGAGAFDGLDEATWLCEISRQPAAELAAGGDVLGLGACIHDRSEGLFDSPADISVDDFSVTLCSWDTFASAMRYAIRSRSHRAVHGGFRAVNTRRRRRDGGGGGGGGWGPGRGTLLGRAREPINAWLPLYVCAAHFRQVEARLPPILGYLVTLDPLGHEEGQELALFAILGQMHAAWGMPVGRATAAAAGGGGRERERMLLREYGRLCHAVQGRAAARLGFDLVEVFVAGAAGPAGGNPMTLVGWAAAAAVDGEGAAAAAERLKQPLLEDEIRRQLFERYCARKAQRALWGAIRQLLYGGAGPAAIMAGGCAAPAAAHVSNGESQRSESGASQAEGSGGRGGAPPGELDLGLWDGDVAAAAASLLARVDLSHLQRAIVLPERELLADRLLLKAVLVNSLMRCAGALASEAAPAGGGVRWAADDPAAVLRKAHDALERQGQLAQLAEEAKAAAMEAARRLRHAIDSEIEESTETFCGGLFGEEGDTP